MDALGVKVERILYGSDYPFTNAKNAENFLVIMDGKNGTKSWGEEAIEKAYYQNAKQLFES